MTEAPRSLSISNGLPPQEQEQEQHQQPPPQLHSPHPQRLPDTDTNPSDLSTVAASVHQRVLSFLSESHPPNSLLAAVQRQTRTSLQVVKTALTRYRLSELSLSYNGGKDCLVLLILFLSGLHEYFASLPEKRKEDDGVDGGGFISSIPAIYALPPDPFPDVENFVRSSSTTYHLAVTKYTTDPPRTSMRSCFESYLSLNPEIKAIFVGTRRTDPHGEKLAHFDPTDHGWPDFMRIHPVIDWHYAQIWAFIRHLDFEYCPLYNMGYTSLGGKTDTHPNPKLRLNSHRSDQEGRIANGNTAAAQRYYPAYELKEDLEERLGRD